MRRNTELPERWIVFPPLPEIDDVTRREFLIGAASLPWLPDECGDGGEEPGGASGEARTAEPLSAWPEETGTGSVVGV